MITHWDHGGHGRPPDPTWYHLSQISLNGYYIPHVGRNYNRFHILSDEPLLNNTGIDITSKPTSLVQFIKRSHPTCPPIVGKENITSNDNWKTVNHKHNNLRKPNYLRAEKNYSPQLKLTTLIHSRAKLGNPILLKKYNDNTRAPQIKKKILLINQ